MTVPVLLSDKARAICAAHWNPPSTRCRGCPIMTPCYTPTAKPLTIHNVNEYTERVNRAAEDLQWPPESTKSS